MNSNFGENVLSNYTDHKAVGKNALTKAKAHTATFSVASTTNAKK